MKVIFLALGVGGTLAIGIIAKWWQIPSNKEEILTFIAGSVLAAVFAIMHTYEKNKIPKGITLLQRLRYSPGIIFRLTLVLLLLSSLFGLIVVQFSP